MTKEQIRPIIMKIIGQIVPDEDLNNLKRDIPIRSQVGPDSMDFLGIMMELRKRYGVEAPGDGYMQLATLRNSIACLEPQTK
ncbi:MAG: acyl carrier protein [Dehalococcoidia bacterium]|nr:acyl carrier protein [Dehalococcoidia bacterium]